MGTPISDTTMLKLWLLALALVALQGPKATLGTAAEHNQNEDIPLETEKMGNGNPVMETVVKSYIEDPFVLESLNGLNRKEAIKPILWHCPKCNRICTIRCRKCCKLP